ncbi:hypothetical protein BDN71DRAFT_1425823 [Pleurotus eryngii]|uniref:Uncharacterized protein n=1 Tax=Pleurotus eryngii TaxID=5323 RepID=A0A9P6DEL3_PLEER|nr:hypothetical protein BDN71DRAFT_1425823 [Pleurotus eryngii]
MDYFAVTIALDLPTNTTLPTATTTTSDPKPIHSVAIIVGSVIGVMVLMMIILAVFRWCRRFRGARASESDTHIRPFDVNISPTPSSSHNVMVAAESLPDSRNPFPFFGQPQPEMQYQQVFYTSPSLPYAEHTLVGSCASGGGRVNYFVVEIPFEIPTNTSFPMTTSAVPTTLDSKPTPPTTAIFGGVLGGLLLLMTILASYLW